MARILAKLHDVVVFKDATRYAHNPVVQRLGGDRLVAVIQEQVRRVRRTHIDPTSRPRLVWSDDAGQTWRTGDQVGVPVHGKEAVNDPSLTVLADGTFLLSYFKWRCGDERDVPEGNPWVRGLDGEHYAWMVGTYTQRSADRGASWEEPVRVAAPTGDATAVSDPCIQLPDGDVLIPLYVSYPGGAYFAMVMRSTDGGRSWGEPAVACRDPLNQLYFGEPSLVHLGGQRVLCMHRVHREKEQEYGYYLYQSLSEDLGRTWEPVQQTQIWGHPAHVMRLASGALLCTYGYRRAAYGTRACLSHDDGVSWDVQNELILRGDGLDTDVGYPTSVQLDDGRILTVWYQCAPPLIVDGRSPGDANDPKTTPGSTLGFIGATLYHEVE